VRGIPIEQLGETAGRTAKSASRRAWRFAALPLLTAAFLQGCQLPSNAPSLSEVHASSAAARIELTEATPELVSLNREPSTASFPSEWIAAAPVDYELIAPGDGVDISLWERDGLQMFAAGPGGFSDLGVFTVGKDGDVDLPYGGKLRLAGVTTTAARSLVLRSLNRLVIAADARVAFVAPRGIMVTVHGDVTRAGVFPIGLNTLRLGDVLALAAPDQTDPDQTLVTLRRDGLSVTVRLSDIYRDPAQNIALRPSDEIVVSALQTFVTVLGAETGQSRVKISRRNYSVLDALADARGVTDSLADPRAVFLLRARAGSDGSPSPERPLVYQFDLRHAEQINLARQFALRDGDAIFVSDAPFTKVQKVMQVFSSSIGAASSLSNISP
jgi:polysaccharide export outer membrane protein